MSKPKLALIPSGYKGGSGEGTVYSILPNDATGDFNYERNGNATRVRKDGLIEELTVDDTPRLDWLNSNCPSLLLEPQRTNYIKYSQDITQSIWNKRNVNYSSNFIDPSGNTNAFKIYPDTVNTEHYLEQTLSITTATTYTASVFLKDGGTSNFEIIIVHVGVGIAVSRALFTITDGVISFSSSTGIIQNVELKDFGNGWYRCEVKYNWTGTVTSHRLRILPRENGTYVGDNINGVYVYGMQVEQASYPTSYIKSEASTVTRLKDNCHLLNQTLFTDYPFTVYAKAKVDAIGNTVFSLVNSTNSNTYLLFYFSSSTQVGVLRRTPSATDSDFYNFTYSVGDTIKVAVAFINDTTYKLYINGTEIADITSGTSIPFQHDDISLGQLRIASDTGTRNSIDDFRVYDYTLNDNELTELTTL